MTTVACSMLRMAWTSGTGTALAAVALGLLVVLLGSEPAQAAGTLSLAQRAQLSRFPTPAGILAANKRRLRMPKPKKVESDPTSTTQPIEGWFDQRLDHFDPTNNKTWKQRWYREMKYYNEGGPAIIFVEGEAECDPAWLLTGDTVDIAKKLGASMFDFEHRYYGESQPTANMSTENLRYLSSDQALADIANFVTYLKGEGYINETAKVIAVGGSYSGNLAAWVRLKYPHIIYASIASSAPVEATEDFIQYLATVSRGMERKAGSWCVENVKKAFDRVQALFANGTNSTEKVLSVFQSCSDFNTSSTLDIQNFYASLGSTFSEAVQYDYPITTSYDLIDDYCSYMGTENETLTDEEAMVALADLLLAESDIDSTSECLDYSYAGTLEYYTNVTWDASMDYRQWMWQTCTEFGYYQTDDSESDQPFGYKLFPLSYSIQTCIDAFGSEYGATEINFTTSNKNLLNGGRNLDVYRVIFVNGDIDPWHTLSRLTPVNPSSPSILISGTSHCYDMYSDDYELDSPQLIAARALKLKYLEELLYGIPDETMLPIDGFQ